MMLSKSARITLRILRVILIVICVLVGLLAIAGIIYYLYADQIRFDYVDGNMSVVTDNYELDERMIEEGYGIHYPFFGNSATLTENSGGVKGYPLGASEKNEPVYQRVQVPISDYYWGLMKEYENNIKMTYDVANDGKLLTVTFDVTAYPNGIERDGVKTDENGDPIGKIFIFDIENASLSHLPKLISEDYEYERPFEQAYYIDGFGAPYADEEWIKEALQVINYFVDDITTFDDQDNDYLIRYPGFKNSNPFFDYPKTYESINRPLREYAESIAEKYGNCAYLEYHIIFDDRNDTRKIQIDFFGNGYPNGIKGNKERIEKQFFGFLRLDLVKGIDLGTDAELTSVVKRTVYCADIVNRYYSPGRSGRHRSRIIVHAVEHYPCSFRIHFLI